MDSKASHLTARSPGIISDVLYIEETPGLGSVALRGVGYRLVTVGLSQLAPSNSDRWFLFGGFGSSKSDGGDIILIGSAIYLYA